MLLEQKDHPHLGAVLLVVPEVDDLAEWRGVQALDHGRVVRPAEPPGGPGDALEQRREVQLRRRGTGLLRLRAIRLRVRAGMGLRQHLQEWTQLTQAFHSLFEKPFGFDPVVEVALHRPLLAGGRQDGRHPVADQDEEDIIEVALGAVRLHEGFHAPGLQRQKALALGIHAQPFGRLPPPGGELHPLRRSEHRDPWSCGPRLSHRRQGHRTTPRN